MSSSQEIIEDSLNKFEINFSHQSFPTHWTAQGFAIKRCHQKFVQLTMPWF